MTPEERLADLETTVAFQDRAIEDLNQGIAGHEARITELEGRLERALEGLRAGTTLVRDPGDEEPPPHY